MVNEHRVERDKGDGSRSAMGDEMLEEAYLQDERQNTHTTYFEHEVDEHCGDERQAERLKRALKYQRGERSNGSAESRSSQNLREDKRRLAETFSAQFELSPAQTERVKHLVTDVLDVNSFGYYSTEQVVLGAVNIVAREDGRWIEDEEGFQSFMREVGITKDGEDAPDMEVMRRLRGLVRDRLDR